ncbi:MAG: orotidine-5'-phosphate decarboxylase [Deltaproteobacteria bacterium]|jgi:orotidine-5'-phosphate decarboxylase|nr:orotidine-5'-phosphate decarboxylase [Deltaproteobacteria bacterium]
MDLMDSDTPQRQRALKRLVFPLDGNRKQVLAWASSLGDLVGYLKVGLELFVSEGPAIIDELKKIAPQAKIFLDLKLHDIPATVAKATKAAAGWGVDLLTIHAQGGSEMARAAARAAGPVKLLGVTVLTSVNPGDLPELAPLYQKGGQWVSLLGQRAIEAGCAGLVASPLEVKALRSQLGTKPILVIPGIRPAWAQVPNDDQKRVGTPFQAIKDGADLLVVGRPISQALDPRQAALAVADEMIF